MSWSGRIRRDFVKVGVSGGGVRVASVAAALDCGRVVHPNGARAQVEGAAMDGVATTPGCDREGHLPCR